MRFRPSEEDLNWGKWVLAKVKDGGTIVMPATGLVYSVSHTDKTLNLINGEVLYELDPFVVHSRSIVVFAKLGYSVRPNVF